MDFPGACTQNGSFQKNPSQPDRDGSSNQPQPATNIPLAPGLALPHRHEEEGFQLY